MQNTTMKQPPAMISNKDLSYIEDMLAWNLTAAKSARDFASKVTDQEIKTELESTWQMHKAHYERLLQYLESNGSTAPGAGTTPTGTNTNNNANQRWQ